MSTHRTKRRLARQIAGTVESKVTLKVGEVVSVTGSTADIYLNGFTEETVGPVPIAPGLVISPGQVVEVTCRGPAPTITRRIT